MKKEVLKAIQELRAEMKVEFKNVNKRHDGIENMLRKLSRKRTAKCKMG